MTRFFKHPNQEQEAYRINIDLVNCYGKSSYSTGIGWNEKEQERIYRITYQVRFYFGPAQMEDYSSFDFESEEDRDKCLKQIDDLLLTKN